jgi:hypothetical protein
MELLFLCGIIMINPYEYALGEYQGFVYCITDTSTNKMYVGKKGFWSKKHYRLSRVKLVSADQLSSLTG